MNVFGYQLAIVFLLSVTIRVSEVCGKKIKIIIPHKISYIHHHHSKMTDVKPKKKPRWNPERDVRYHHQYHHHHQQEEEEGLEEEEEDSEEELNEGQYGYYRGEQEPHGSYGGLAYYAIPGPMKFVMNPMILYKKPFQRVRHPHEFFGYEDYWQGMRHPRDHHLMTTFRYK